MARDRLHAGLLRALPSRPPTRPRRWASNGWLPMVAGEPLRPLREAPLLPPVDGKRLRRSRRPEQVMVDMRDILCVAQKWSGTADTARSRHQEGKS